MFGLLKNAVKGIVEKISGKGKKKDEERGAKAEERAKARDVGRAKKEKEEKPEKAKLKRVEERKEEKAKGEKKRKEGEVLKKEKGKAKRRKIEEKAKVSLPKAITSLITGKVKIEEKEIEEMLDEFELSLLEADVALGVAERIKERLKERIVGKEVEKNKLKEFVKSAIEETLKELMPSPMDIVEEIKKSEERPYKVVFFGPNGSGKTTAIAKLANALKNEGLSVVLSASDTFRAAAIEQLEEHAKRLNVEIIKGKYGADPSSVAYSAIEHAKAKGIDVVLIDTAGRLEVDTNLMRELEKIVRVVKPNLKLFVAEVIAGATIYDVVKEYDEIVGIDAVVLTKMDLDAKGGVALSIYAATNIPVAFVSYGQKYEEIKPFDKEEIVEAILSE